MEKGDINQAKAIFAKLDIPQALHAKLALLKEGMAPSEAQDFLQTSKGRLSMAKIRVV